MRSRLPLLTAVAALLGATACSDSRTTEPSGAKPAPGRTASLDNAPGLLTGPVFPAPGGTDYVNGGSDPTVGVLTRAYSGIDASLFSTLVWMPMQVQLSMNGSANDLAFDTGLSSLAGGLAVWSGSSPVQLVGGGSTVNLQVVLNVTNSDGSPLPLVSSAGTIGVPVAGSGFKITLAYLAQHPLVSGGAWLPLAAVYNALPTLPVATGQLQSSFDGEFFYTLAPCAAGQYRNGPACIDAPPGTYSAGGTATPAAIQCVRGTYQPDAGQTSCIPAPAGSYVADVGAVSATPCAAGTYSSNGLGSVSCTTDPPGSYSLSGAAGPTPCAAGYFQPASGQASCIPASPGSHVPETGATSSSFCLTGSYSTGAAAFCTPAPVGSYVPTMGASSPTPCPAGHTTIAIGSSFCLALAPQFIAITSVPPSPAFSGGSYTVSATGGPSGNPVLFSASGACTVAGNVVSFVTAGACTVTANQQGKSIYLDATPVSQSFTILPPTPQALAGVVVVQVQTLVTNGTLSANDASPLTDQLNAAIQSYTRGSTKAGDNQMGAFINHVQALQHSERVPDAAAAALIAAAQVVIAAG